MKDGRVERSGRDWDGLGRTGMYGPGWNVMEGHGLGDGLGWFGMDRYRLGWTGMYRDGGGWIGMN